MTTLIFVLHVISCLFLISLILVQKGQGANIGAAFGGASQTVFGPRGPTTFLNKLTIVVAVVFLSASIFLAHVAKTRTTSTVVDEAKKIETEEAGAANAVQKDVAPPVEKKEEGK